MILSQVNENIPIHTISFNCTDPEANQFLYQLAHKTKGRLVTSIEAVFDEIFWFYVYVFWYFVFFQSQITFISANFLTITVNSLSMQTARLQSMLYIYGISPLTHGKEKYFSPSFFPVKYPRAIRLFRPRAYNCLKQTMEW